MYKSFTQFVCEFLLFNNGEFLNTQIFWKYKNTYKQQKLQKHFNTDYLGHKSVPYYTLKFGRFLSKHPVACIYQNLYFYVR